MALPADRRWGLAVFVVLAVAGSVQSVWVGVAFGSTTTSEDQQLLLIAARDWLHLSVPEPAFYGQSYGTTFEAWPATIALALGGDPTVALSVSAAVVHWAAWVIFGAIAVTRNQMAPALIAVSSPLLISNDYVLLSSFSMWFVGPAVAVLGSAMTWRATSNGARTAWLAVALLGTVWAPSGALVVAPVAVRFAVQLIQEGSHWWRVLLRLAAAAVPAVVWYLAVSLFYRAHANYLVHSNPGDYSLHNLRLSVASASQNLAILGPELAKSGLLFVALAALTIALCVATRNWSVILPAGAFVLVVLAAALSDRAGETAPLLPGARLFYFAPLGLWLLGTWSFEALAGKHPRVLVSLPVLAAMAVVLAMITIPARIATTADDWRVRTNDIYSTTMRTDRLEGVCQRVGRVMDEIGASLVVFLDNSTEAYGCAVAHPNLTTLYPAFDRRTPVVIHESQTIRSGFIVVGQAVVDCLTPAGKPIADCTVIDSITVDGLHPVYFGSEGRSAVTVIADLGLPVRAF